MINPELKKEFNNLSDQDKFFCIAGLAGISISVLMFSWNLLGLGVSLDQPTNCSDYLKIGEATNYERCIN